MTLGARVHVLGRDHINYTVNMHHFFKNLFLKCQAYFRQTKFKVIMTKVGSTIIVHDTRGWSFCSRAWPY